MSFVYYLSFIIYHLLFVIYYFSFIISHLLFVIYYLSFIIYHWLFIICHLLFFDCYLSIRWQTRIWIFITRISDLFSMIMIQPSSDTSQNTHSSQRKIISSHINVVEYDATVVDNNFVILFLHLCYYVVNHMADNDSPIKRSISERNLTTREFYYTRSSS